MNCNILYPVSYKFFQMEFIYFPKNMNFNIVRKLHPASFKFLQKVCNVNRIVAKNTLINTSTKVPLLQRNVLIISTTLAFLWPVKKQKELPENISTGISPSVLETADNLFSNGHYEECYELLKQHEHDTNVEIQWRLCRVMYNMSKELKYDKSHQQNLMLEAFEIISKQLERDSNHYAVHQWYAILLDVKSSLKGVKERIRQLTTVKKHLDLAVLLNPNDATILFILGEWCFHITELPWHQRKIAEVLFASPPHSTYEDALEYFLKAESIHPRFYSLNLLRIGICYFRLKKEDQAKYYLKLAASYPAKSNDDHRANTEAAELLKKLK